MCTIAVVLSEQDILELEKCVDKIEQDITDYISYGKFYTCRPQNVHIAEITLTSTAVAADDTILSKWWYLLAVVHGARLCSTCTVTPRHLIQPRTSLCLD